MRNLALYLGASFVASCGEIIVWRNFYSCKIDFRELFFYIAFVLMCFLGLLNYSFVNVYVRIIIISVVLSFANWLIFSKKMNETLVCTLYGQLLLALSDVIGIVLVIIFSRNSMDFIKNSYFGSLVGNILVSSIFILISKVPIIKTIYLKLVDFTNNFKKVQIINTSLLLIISINVLLALMFYEINGVYVIVVNLLLLFIYSVIVFLNIKVKSKNITIEKENLVLMESLHQYEDMVDRQRVDNHENKNQLLIIKNMIKKNDKDVIKYIDTVVKDEKEDDEALYTKVKSIPSGGLQGIIYQKMLSMKDNRILFSLDVSRDVRHIDLEKMNIEDNYKLCKIVGVLLDNAIEGSLKIDDKCIMISLYIDDDMLVIDISNRFDGNIDLDRIDDEGYTTKGVGHGYGLSLVKKLVSESDCFINERKINKDIFKQIIKLKLK